MPESSVRWFPDDTPTVAARVIAHLRHIRATTGTVPTGDLWTLLAAYDRLEAELATRDKRIAELDAVVDSLGIPGEDAA